MAKAYLVANVAIRDAEGYEKYRSRTGPIVDRFGGKFLVRGGTIHAMEGALPGERLVIIEFPSLDAAKGFYECDDYRAIIGHRIDNTDSILLIAEGVPES